MDAVVIDDEQYCCDVLNTLLAKYCPQVSVTATCSSPFEGLEVIRSTRPSLVFLDIEMPQMNGFQMLEQLGNIDFNLVFTTSYDQYALKAFSFSAMDYLLKPIDKNDLVKAVEKAEKRPQQQINKQLEILLDKLNTPMELHYKIALPTIQGLEIINTQEIISCTAESNYTSIVLKNKKKFVVSKTLKEIEDLLNPKIFLRVHNSHVINMNEIHRYVKGEGGYLIMSNDSSVDVSRSRKDVLMQRLIQKK